MRNPPTLVASILIALFAPLAPAEAQHSISGTVVNHNAASITSGSAVLVSTANTMTPLLFVSVSNGAYSFTGVADGSYYVIIFQGGLGGETYITETYNDVQCPAVICDFTNATAITVAGADVSGINFALNPGGKITGTVTDGSAPLSGVSAVSYFSAATTPPSLVSFAQPNASGVYTISALAPGAYYLIASNPGYVSESYPDVPCPVFGCTFSGATSITVADGQTVSNIDFQLAQGGKVGGKITDAVTGGGLAGTVLIQKEGGGGSSYATSNAQGVYEGAEGLAPGNYLVTAAVTNYLPELYENFACANFECDSSDGTPVAVAAGQTTTVDFALNSMTTLNDLTGKLTGVPATKKAKKPAFTVKNVGALAVTGFSVKFYGSKSKQLGGKAKPFKTIEVDTLGPNEEKKIPFSLKGDSKFLIVVIDAGNQVTELSETNNKVTKKL